MKIIFSKREKQLETHIVWCICCVHLFGPIDVHLYEFSLYNKEMHMLEIKLE